MIDMVMVGMCAIGQTVYIGQPVYYLVENLIKVWQIGDTLFLSLLLVLYMNQRVGTSKVNNSSLIPPLSHVYTRYGT